MSSDFEQHLLTRTYNTVGQCSHPENKISSKFVFWLSSSLTAYGFRSAPVLGVGYNNISAGSLELVGGL